VPVTCNPKSGSDFAKGPTPVTCTAPAPGGSSVTCAFTVTVVDCSTSTLSCPSDMTQCADPGQCSAVVNYPPAPAGAAPLVCDPKSGSVFPTGTATVTCHSTDAAGNTKTCGFTVTVNACQPPKVLSLTATPAVLWPPNHQMVPVTLEVKSGNCAPVDCRIVSISSSESQAKGPHGAAAQPWKITGDLTAELMAERSGKGSGRVYTLTVQCTDPSGAITTSTVAVPVAHDHSSLSHSLQGHQLTLGWDATDTTAVLESTEDLGQPDWRPVSTTGSNQMTVPTTGASKFFRLRP
jgi:hypothetical protein